MRKILKQYGLLICLSLILIAGFGFITLASYKVSRDTVYQNSSEQALPVTSDAVLAELQKDILRPVLIASQMANNTFVRDWIINAELDKTTNQQPDQKSEQKSDQEQQQNTEQITHYLKEIKSKNNAATSFLASAITHQSYSPDGTQKTITASEARDKWFFRVANLKTAYEINVDTDVVNRDSMTIAINHRILDYNDKFIGVAGVSVTLDTMRRLIDSYQSSLHRTIYFVDQKGTIVLAGSAMRRSLSNLQDTPGMRSIAGQILANKKIDSQLLDYKNETENIAVSERFIPELGWHLLVEQEVGSNIKPLQDIFQINLAVSAAIMLIVIVLLVLSVRRFQQRLEKSAATDQLTSLPNRHAFDFVFQQALLDSGRSRLPLCVALIDIDFFKKVNDKNGHLVGDHVLKEIALIAKRSLRESDVICRWGGEEFLILLKNCTLEKATSIAENLRSTIAANDFSRTTDLAKKRLAVTVSMGVAQCKDNETEDSVFDRAEVALQQAKENGRNSVYFSE